MVTQTQLKFGIMISDIMKNIQEEFINLINIFKLIVYGYNSFPNTVISVKFYLKWL